MAAGAAVSLATRQALADAGRPTLYVFVQTDVKSAALERALSSKLTSLEITVFGKFRDLEYVLSTRRPDALLAATPVLEAQHIGVAIEGTRKNLPSEPLVILSTEEKSINQLAGATVGVVDMLGREEMQRFVERTLRVQGVKTKLVTKVEDLLSLLRFSYADAVLAGESAVQPFLQRSRLPLKVKEVPNSRLGLPAIGILNPQAKEAVARAILGMSVELCRMLAIDRWRIT